MFIQCSDCDYKYIVNSADLKPDGRMVECANCNHRWYQEPLQSEELLSSSVPHVPQEDQVSKVKNNLEENDVKVTEEIKNLPIETPTEEPEESKTNNKSLKDRQFDKEFPYLIKTREFTEPLDLDTLEWSDRIERALKTR